MANAAAVGNYLLEQLRSLQAESVATANPISDVRGRGLMIGIEFRDSVKELRGRLMREQHVFTGASGTNVIRLLPPLVLTKADADEFITRLKRVL